MKKMILTLSLLTISSMGFALDTDSAYLIGERASSIISGIESTMDLECSLDNNGYTMNPMGKDSAKISCQNGDEIMKLKIKFLDEDQKELKITIH